MPDDKQYPYGYQLSFSERLKLRLKRINYHLSLGIWIIFFIVGGIALLTEKVVSESQWVYWRNYWGGVLFFLFGFQGLIWAITGEIKTTANLTNRGKWVVLAGILLWTSCWGVVVYIILNSLSV
jgi:hypothetical protein